MTKVLGAAAWWVGLVVAAGGPASAVGDENAAQPATAAAELTPAQCAERAEASGRIAGYSLSKVQRWLREAALKKIDPNTGLYLADGRWNYRDTAADCYPFFIWAAWATDEAVLRGPARDILHAEIKLCNLLDRIPVAYDFARKAPLASQPLDRTIFGASEYVKDGLIAVVEVTGRDEWFQRMRDIVDDIWKHAPVETPLGRIPSTNVEVNGEQIQALARLFTMTGDRKYLAWAQRLADYYLKDEAFVPTRLRDHGCEIIGGLGLLLGVESEHDAARAAQRLGRIRKMLEEISRRGTNADGFMLNSLSASPGPHSGALSDGWGYNYVTYLCWDQAAGKELFRPRVAATLGNLAKPAYRNYPWEGRSIDGFADSIEGAIYLLNRLPVQAGLAWVDREMADNVVRSAQPLETAALWGTHKLESNGVRTTIMHALMHTRGLLARPWRADLTLGACQSSRSLTVVLKADKDWTGRLVFDIPRHRLYMGFRTDWPRMNALPEWYTVDPPARYPVRNAATGGQSTHTGEALHKGLPLTVQAGQTLRMVVSPAGADAR